MPFTNHLEPSAAHTLPVCEPSPADNFHAWGFQHIKHQEPKEDMAATMIPVARGVKKCSAPSTGVDVRNYISSMLLRGARARGAEGEDPYYH